MNRNDHIQPRSPMSAVELRSAAALAGIYFLRMFGLFLILPVFSLYGSRLQGATPFLTGLAMGAYGLTQMVFQVPFGMLSDRLGRKPVITGGLILFAGGSVVAALSNHIVWVILGRALQGAGAISSAVMALAADLTREEQRTKAMALIGVSIGLAFAGAFVAGPALDAAAGLHGLFWMAAAMALGAIVVLYAAVPQPVQSRFHRECEAEPGQLRAILLQPDLLRLNMGILFLHATLTASFVALPITLRDDLGLAGAEHWKLYLPALVVSVALLLPLLRLADRGTRGKEIFLCAIAALAVALVGLALSDGMGPPLFAMVVLFFTAFNYLEASLPALVSQVAPAEHRGTALGLYAMSQFLGTFIGGALGGGLFGVAGVTGVFSLGAVLALAWLVIAARMTMPRRLRTQLLHVGSLEGADATALATRIRAVDGVAEAVVDGDEGVAYVKVDAERIDWKALQNLVPARE